MTKFEINPYEILGIDVKANEEDIRKAYRKQCLKYHPDKQHASSLTDQDKEEIRTKFEEVQFAHSVLSDSKRRKRYDSTGSLEESIGEDDDFDWLEYFKSVKAEINEDSIKKDKLIYQNSEDEESDIIESWIETNGDFLALFENIPHTELTDEEEKRLFNKVKDLIKDNIIEDSESFKTYQKTRKRSFKKLQKKHGKEAEQAEKLKKELDVKFNSTNELKALIQNKRKNDMDSLIARLEQKYVKPKKQRKK